jgi:hypothetical protein
LTRLIISQLTSFVKRFFEKSLMNVYAGGMYIYACPRPGIYGKFCRVWPELPFLPENGRATIFWKFGALWSVGAPPKSPINGTLSQPSHKMPKNPRFPVGSSERRYK